MIAWPVWLAFLLTLHTIYKIFKILLCAIITASLLLFEVCFLKKEAQYSTTFQEMASYFHLEKNIKLINTPTCFWNPYKQEGV